MPSVRVALPPSFVQEETTVVWAPRADTALSDPRMLQTQVTSRPSLVTQTRRVARNATLGRLAAEICVDLRATIPMQSIVARDVAFADGTPGVLLELVLALDGPFEVAQLQLIRLDGELLTTLTYSIERSSLTTALRDETLHSLLAARLAG